MGSRPSIGDDKGDDPARPVLVAITGIPRKPWTFLRFLWVAAGALAASAKARGNLHTAAKNIGMVEHTLTVWTSHAAMMDYVHGDDHARVMQQFDAFHDKERAPATFHYWTAADDLPTWEEVHALWYKAANSREFPADRVAAPK
jgi:hypothetical protein